MRKDCTHLANIFGGQGGVLVLAQFKRDDAQLWMPESQPDQGGVAGIEAVDETVGRAG